MKGETGARGWARDLRRTLPQRAVLIAGCCAFSLLVNHTPDSFWHHLQYWQPELAILGALFAVASTGLLLWARWVRGVMWASIPLVHERHELRTDGPYRIVRHPIYTGLLGMVLGGMLAYRTRVPALVPWTRPAPAGPRAVGSRQGWSGVGRVVVTGVNLRPRSGS
ncbi:methyltransferase family protein [Streptomyces sp. NPDC048504]|uniref:methyltransferase family protein n=1 Tax=Streptomyces sp. NPDC048504 TaxID=3365559 RepID=UPI003724107F